jgi:hypothetical protein
MTHATGYFAVWSFAFAILGTPFGADAATIGTCTPSKVRYVIENGGSVASTNSLYLRVPGMKTTIFQGGTVAKCVIVLFSAGIATNTIVSIRVVQDGTKTALPSAEIFVHENNTTEARSRTFIFPNVAPGRHEIEIQYKTDQQSLLTQPNMVVYYIP